MLVIFVLTKKRNGVLSFIRILLRHVEIIDELEQLELSEWGICLTGFLFELAFKLALKKS